MVWEDVYKRQEYGYSEDEINKKVESTWEKLFHGNDDERLYNQVGDDMAYIYTCLLYTSRCV